MRNSDARRSTRSMTLSAALVSSTPITHTEDRQFISPQIAPSRSNRSGVEQRRLYVDMNNQYAEDQYNSMTERVRLRNRTPSSILEPIHSSPNTPFFRIEERPDPDQQANFEPLDQILNVAEVLNNSVLPNEAFVIPAVDMIDIFRENYVFPAVRGLPASDEVRSLFTEVFSLLVRHLILLPKEASIHCKRATFAIQFLPCILRFKRGQRHHISIIRDMRGIIGIDSFDSVNIRVFFNGVQKLLQYREQWINRNGYNFSKSSTSFNHQSKAKRIQRSLFLTKNGQFSRALNALSQNNSHIDIFDTEGNILESFKEKINILYPVEDISALEFISQNDSNESYIVTNQQVLFQIQKSKRGSSSGLSCWTFELFKTLAKNSSGGDNLCFLDHLTQLCNLLISGNAGDPDWWLSTQLVCIPKPNGSIRPIGIQNVFIRLASSSVANIVSQDVVEKLKEKKINMGLV